MKLLTCVRRVILTVIIIFSFTRLAVSDELIKQPNVSGKFYTSDALQLSKDIQKFLSNAQVDPYKFPIDVIIAPHAGYVFSGDVAAHSYKAVSQQNYKTVVILAPSHFFGFQGLSVWGEGGFQTPLGVVDVDQAFAKQLIDSDKQILFQPKAFEKEHSLEVQIPFLQETFHDLRVVPVIIGQPSFQTLQKFAETLNKIVGDRKDVLVVISTDLSHYHDSTIARTMDLHSIEAIKNFQTEKIVKEYYQKTMEMCGFMPVIAGLLYAKERGLDQADVLKYAHSGDVTGERARVVGYVAVAIYQKNVGATRRVALTMEQKQKLIDIARQTVESYVRTGEIPEFDVQDPRLLEVEGAFVTIHKNGQLRGCIGNIVGQAPLCLTVRNMAVSSAAQDPRFAPVTLDELDEIDVEVSVLSKPTVIKNVMDIELGVHGVIVSKGTRSGVFLPQVATETGWSKEEFLSELCSQKAGLPRDCWKDSTVKFETFTADVLSENDMQGKRIMIH